MNNKQTGLLMVVVIAMLMSCAPQLDDTPPPPYDDVRYGANIMYVTSSFRVYAPVMDRMHVERLALNVYGVRSVSWSPGSYIMTVQYYPGRTNTYLIQQAIARAGYDTSDYRAVNMRPVVIPSRPTPPTRQVITVPRTQQPPRTAQPQPGQGGRVGVNNPNTHSGTTQPRTQGGNVQPQSNQNPQQTTTKENPQGQPATNTSAGGHFGGKRN